MIRATKKDIDCVYGIIEECSAWLKTKGVQQWNPTYPRDLFLKDVEKGAVCYFMEGDSLGGTATIYNEKPSYYPTDIWYTKEKVWYLCRFAVPRRLKGKKLGIRIIAALETKGEQDGVEWIRLDVAKANPFLQSYYSNLGYQCAGEVMLVDTPSILMEKRIGATPVPPAWTESDSQKFTDLGDIFVPDRDLQNQTLCELLSLPTGETTVVEIYSGQGLLAERVLETYPHTHVYALDGSKEMIAQSRSRLSRFSSRFQVHSFDLYSSDCMDGIPQANAVVASLAIHHLDTNEKRSLFKKVQAALTDEGVFLLCDIVQPTTRAGADYAASQWESAVRESSNLNYS